ncbi:MAG: hypothetical protein SFY96_09925 [Planctomycetota bacterium]|nr:hypothetical protein [Planctomycetota bacterium]
MPNAVAGVPQGGEGLFGTPCAKTKHKQAALSGIALPDWQQPYVFLGTNWPTAKRACIFYQPHGEPP